MPTIQLSGALLVAGWFIFWAGAFQPTTRVHLTSDADFREKLINERDSYWIVSHIMFVIGAVTTTAGMAIFTSTIEGTNARVLAIVGLVAVVLGTFAWIHIVFAFRLLMPSEEYVRTTAGGWTFPTYTALTLGGLILYGIVLLLSDFPTWLGLVIIGLNSMILITYYVWDMGPGLFYITTLIMGIVFLVE